MIGAVDLEPTLLGVVLGLLFLTVMIVLFRWMFSIPRGLPREAAEARYSVTALGKILVPVRNDIASGRAVELACRLGREQQAEIVLVHVVEVPLTLPLTAAPGESAALGEEALHTAESIVQKHKLPFEAHLIHERYAHAGILRVAVDEKVNAIILGIGIGPRGTVLPDRIGTTAIEVLRRAPCEVILDRSVMPV